MILGRADKLVIIARKVGHAIPESMSRAGCSYTVFVSANSFAVKTLAARQVGQERRGNIPKAWLQLPERSCRHRGRLQQKRIGIFSESTSISAVGQVLFSGFSKVVGWPVFPSELRIVVVRCPPDSTCWQSSRGVLYSMMSSLRPRGSAGDSAMPVSVST